MLNAEFHQKSKICPTRFRHSLPATRHSACATILLSKIHPKFKIQHPKFSYPSIPPVAVFATTPASGFVEMIFSLSEIHHSKSNITAFATASRRSREACRRTVTFHFSLFRFQLFLHLLPANPVLLSKMLSEPKIQHPKAPNCPTLPLASRCPLETL